MTSMIYFFLQNSLLILVSYSVPLDPSMIPDLSRVLSFLPPNLVIDQRLNYLVFFFMVTSVQPTERFQKAPLLGKIVSAEEPCQLKLPPVCPNSASAYVCVESLVDLGLLSSYCTQLLPPLQTEPVLTHIITTQSKLFWGTAEHLGGVLSSDYGCIYNPSSKSLQSRYTGQIPCGLDKQPKGFLKPALSSCLPVLSLSSGVLFGYFPNQTSVSAWCCVYTIILGSHFKPHVHLCSRLLASSHLIHQLSNHVWHVMNSQ